MSDVLPVSMSTAKEQEENFFIELYVLQLRTGVVRIAACDENIMFDGDEYVAVPFQRQNIVRSMDNITDSVEISLADCSYELLSFVMNGFDFRGCTATIFRIQYPDSLTDNTISQWIFSGYIDNPAYSNGVFTCKIVSRFPEIECPNRTYQLACNSDFGDEDCTKSLDETNITITAATGNTVTINVTKDSDYWKNGVITVLGESRIIERSSGNVLTLNVNFIQSNLIGKAGTVCRGCNKTTNDCRRHNNLQHYNGFPAIPFENVYR